MPVEGPSISALTLYQMLTQMLSRRSVDLNVCIFYAFRSMRHTHLIQGCFAGSIFVTKESRVYFEGWYTLFQMRLVDPSHRSCSNFRVQISFKGLGSKKMFQGLPNVLIKPPSYNSEIVMNHPTSNSGDCVTVSQTSIFVLVK